MDSKEFFGGDDPGVTAKPSVLSIIVGQAVQEFTAYYHPAKDGSWTVGGEGWGGGTVPEESVIGDISQWVRHLQGDGGLGDAIVVLVKGNPGWEKIIARRVMRELRKWTA